MVRPGQQSIQHGAGDAAVSPVLLQAGSDLLFEFFISTLQRLFHCHRHDFLPVAWQTVRDVFQADERAVVHQILAEQQRRSARFTFDRDRFLGFPGAGVVFDRDALDRLDHTEVPREAFPPGRAPFVAVLSHALSFGAEQRVEQIIRIAREQGPRQSQEPSCRFVEHSESIALSCVAGQLVNLIRNGVIPPFRHVAPHVFRRRHARDLAVVGLPQRANT